MESWLSLRRYIITGVARLFCSRAKFKRDTIWQAAKKNFFLLVFLTFRRKWCQFQLFFFTKLCLKTGKCIKNYRKEALKNLWRDSVWPCLQYKNLKQSLMRCQMLSGHDLWSLWEDMDRADAVLTNKTCRLPPSPDFQPHHPK